MESDVQSGGIPGWVTTIFISLVAVGGLATVVVMSDKPETTQKINLDSSLFSNPLPDGFLSSRALEAKEVKRLARKKQNKVQKKEKTVRTKQKKQPQVKAYTAPPVDYAAIAERRRLAKIEAINRQRRGTGIAFTAYNGSFGANSTEEWKNTEDDFSSQGTGGLEASFPVNLERTITADKFISAAVINNIHSQLPGKIVAQIDKHVYGSHGKKILIPAGSKAVGQYFPTGKVGDTRIRAIWTRIITPEGINIVLGNAEMADSWGRAGVTGKVDARIWERYGVALLISTITAAGQMAVPVDTQAQANGVNTFSQEMSRTTQTILENNIGLKPIIKIDAGTKIFLQPLEDIWFKKPIKRTVIAQRTGA